MTEWLTPADVARELQVSPRTVGRWIERGAGSKRLVSPLPFGPLPDGYTPVFGHLGEASDATGRGKPGIPSHGRGRAARAKRKAV